MVVIIGLIKAAREGRIDEDAVLFNLIAGGIFVIGCLIYAIATGAPLI